MLSSLSFILSSLMFRSLIHFEFIFLWMLENALISFFFFLNLAAKFFHQNLLKRLSFLHYKSCLLCCRLIDHGCTGLFLDFPPCFMDLYDFVLVPCCFDDCSLVI